ncbi:hypothetical protein RB195_011987 [Necator americanus]|uniref:Uncharacterized protein n=1 Tax=Necator americanus TaxID=51031 RepID=A0ABR1D4Y6_NECAM
MMFNISNQHAAIAEIDANATMGLEQQSDGFGKRYYPAEQTSYNNRLVDLCDHASLLLHLKGITDPISLRSKYQPFNA